MAMERDSENSAAAMAARNPAPPPPTIRMSCSIVSSAEPLSDVQRPFYWFGQGIANNAPGVTVD
jgi:hypothetical protein